MDEEAMPFPRDETTPPVVKMNLVLGFATGFLWTVISLDPNIPKP